MIRQLRLIVDEELPQMVMLSLIICVGFLGHYHPGREPLSGPVRSTPQS